METKKSKISIDTTFNTSIENVWAAWTEPGLMNWFGSDPNGTVSETKLDVRPGGSFEITFKDSDDTEFTCTGIYKEVLKFNKLTFSWSWKNDPESESFVTLNLIKKENKTQMLFEHSNIGIVSKHDYLYGWKGAFSKLEKTLLTLV